MAFPVGIDYFKKKMKPMSLYVSVITIYERNKWNIDLGGRIEKRRNTIFAIL